MRLQILSHGKTQAEPESLLGKARQYTLYNIQWTVVIMILIQWRQMIPLDKGFPKETPINSFAYYMNFNITNIWSLARTLKQLFFFESSSPSSIPCWRFHAPKKWDRSSRTLLSCLIRMTSFGCWFPLQVWWFFKKLFRLFLLLLMVNSSRKENIVDTILCMLHNHTHS